MKEATSFVFVFFVSLRVWAVGKKKIMCYLLMAIGVWGSDIASSCKERDLLTRMRFGWEIISLELSGASIFRYLSSFKESNNLKVESLFVKTQRPKVSFREGLLYWGIKARFLGWGTRKWIRMSSLITEFQADEEQPCSADMWARKQCQIICWLGYGSNWWENSLSRLSDLLAITAQLPNVLHG